MSKVVKFGGSSLADATQFQKVYNIIKSDPERRFVVPSAPGKRFKEDTKVTDLLYKIFYAKTKNEFHLYFDQMKERFLDIIEGLQLDMSLEDEFTIIQKALENVEDCKQVKDSFNLVHKQVLETLQKLGLEEIEAEGQQFDPNFHEAVMQTPTSEHPEHTIINVLQKGYKMGDKVLRPSLVNVATAE